MMNVPTTRVARVASRRHWALLALGALLVAAVVIADPSVPLVTPQQLLERQQAKDAELFVLDVRTAEEFVSGHVPGAVNIPHDQLASRLAEVPKDKDVVLYCRSGRRTMLAAEVLSANGYQRLGHLEGDILGWTRQDRPLTRPADPAACVAALAARTPAPQACVPN